MSLLSLTTFSIMPGRTAGFRAAFGQAMQSHPASGVSRFLVEIGEVNTLICVAELAGLDELPRHCAWAADLDRQQKAVLRATRTEAYAQRAGGLAAADLRAPGVMAVLLEDIAADDGEAGLDARAVTLDALTGALGRRLRLTPFHTMDAALNAAIARRASGQNDRNALLIPEA